MYSTILREVFLPYVLRRDRRSSALAHWRFLERSQFWSRQQLLDYQWQQLKRLLSHAYETSPYYTRVFNERSLTPDSFRSFEDLAKLPVLTRDHLFTCMDELLSTRYERGSLQKFNTGGTTGQRATLYRDQESFNIKLAVAWRYEGWIGCKPCDKMALVWPAHVDFTEKGSWKTAIRNRYIMRQQMYYAGRMAEDSFREMYRRMRRFKPRGLKCFPDALYGPSLLIRQHKLEPPPLRGIMSTGSPLYDYQKELFEELYNCPVYDMYGSREVGNTACECQAREGLHIAMETTLVEFISNGRPVECGQPGEITITDLTNYAVPVIRYSIDDRGVPLGGECSCGRGLSLMSPGVGRLSDDFWGPDGEWHSGSMLMNHLTAHGPAAGQMQIVQNTRTNFLVRITNDPKPTRENFDYVTNAMREIIGHTIDVTFKTVEKIPREKSGKYRFMICEIDPPANAFVRNHRKADR